MKNRKLLNKWNRISTWLRNLINLACLRKSRDAEERLEDHSSISVIISDWENSKSRFDNKIKLEAHKGEDLSKMVVWLILKDLLSRLTTSNLKIDPSNYSNSSFRCKIRWSKPLAFRILTKISSNLSRMFCPNLLLKDLLQMSWDQQFRIIIL